MTQSLSPFYPIFDSSDWLQRLLPLGIKMVQLRVKGRSEDNTRDEIKRSKILCHQHDCLLIVNDYWQIAIDEDCDYLHLGQEDLDDADVPAIKKAGIQLGISTHSEEELERAMSFDPDYIALGPIYPTILKEMPWQPQGLEKIGQWKKAINGKPLIGIGGISLDRASHVLGAGADVVSLVTDITLNPDPEQRTREWVALTDSFKSN